MNGQSSPIGRPLLVATAVVGATGVIVGAFGAHALDLEGASESVFETATRYHLVHAVAVGFTALAGDRVNRWSGWLFVVGVVLFSGSLYALALRGPSWLGPITPVGGMAFVAGWLSLPFVNQRPRRHVKRDRDDETREA